MFQGKKIMKVELENIETPAEGLVEVLLSCITLYQ